jgi:hypothetical protein
LHWEIYDNIESWANCAQEHIAKILGHPSTYSTNANNASRLVFLIKNAELKEEFLINASQEAYNALENHQVQV